MASLRSVREVARVICVNSGLPCAQMHDPTRSPCTYSNCRIMPLARDAIEIATARHGNVALRDLCNSER